MVSNILLERAQAINNSYRKKETAEWKEKWCSVLDMSVVKIKSSIVKKKKKKKILHRNLEC